MDREELRGLGLGGRRPGTWEEWGFGDREDLGYCMVAGEPVDFRVRWTMVTCQGL